MSANVTAMPTDFKSARPEIAWPAAPTQRAANLLAVLGQLEQSQWWSPEQVAAHQFRQLAALVAHALDTVPYYRDTLAGLRTAALNGDLRAIWPRIPVITRHDVQRAGEALFSTRLPAAHGKTSEIKTSGSTGSPVRILTTDVTQLFWEAFTLRDHRWHARDLAGKLAALRRMPDGIAAPPQGLPLKGWGPPVDLVYRTGPATVLGIVSTVEEQAHWLLREQPDYLLTFPTALRALAEHCLARDLRVPALREVRTLGEVVTPELRALCRAAWDVPLVDIYSTQEAGYLALQCPQHGHYHVQAENALVEILDDRDQPCASGQAGRVVVTPLHNFATPLLRYATGDYAEAGEPCPCGRGLPVIRRIMGRARNMLTYPTGERRFPLLGGEHYADYAPVRQYQVVQRQPDLLEVRLVMHRAPDAGEEQALRRFIEHKLGPAFRIALVYCDELPRTPGGKFEDFISEVAATPL